MIDEKETTSELEVHDPLREIALDYILPPDATDDERLQKMTRGFYVELDPKTALRDIPSRVGGYKNGERRRDIARQRVLGSHPELSFVIASLPVRAVVPMWGNDYLGSHVVGRSVVGELHNMELSDSDVMAAMKDYALKQVANGEASEEAVAAFIARLSTVDPKGVPRLPQF